MRPVPAALMCAAAVFALGCKRTIDPAVAGGAGEVRGRVHAGDGRPITGAEVVLEPQTGGSSGAAPRTKVSGTGEFVIENLRAGRYLLRAEAPGHGSSAFAIELRGGDRVATRLRLSRAQNLEGTLEDGRGAPLPDAQVLATLRLARGARVSGRVLSADGRPLRGASVSVVATGAGAAEEEMGVLPGALPLAAEAARLSLDQLVQRSRVRSTATDVDGRFLLEDLAPGRASIEIIHPEMLPRRPDPLYLAAGERKELGDIALEAGVLITGSVNDEDGRAVAPARVEARPARGRARAMRVAVDGDGSFAIRVPAGEYALSAHASGRAPQELAPFQAVPGRTPARLAFRLVRAEGSLAGRVQAAAGGRPLSKVRVVAFPLPDGVAAGSAFPPRARDGELALAGTATDAAGRFTLAGLPRGLLIIEARHQAYAPAAVVAEVGRPAVIALARPGGVEGEVRDSRTGAFVGRYQIEAVGPVGQRAERIRLMGAGFEVTGLAPGRWTFRLTAPGYRPLERTVDVPSGPVRDQPSVRNLRLRLDRL